MSKAAAKNAKADAAKVAKKKPDPDGLKLIEAGDAAMNEKNFEKAIELFTAAKDKCESSTVAAVAKEKKPKAVPAEGAAAAAADKEKEKEKEEEGQKPKLQLRNPAENMQAKPLRDGVDDEHNYALNTEAQLKTHLDATKGKYMTRFPPEPNGYLHIGHAKAMNFNFGQAVLGREVPPPGGAASAAVGGETIMRFDDTNPTAEKQEFIDSILDNVAWLGHTPLKTTYSSDYFQKLYDLALELIEAGGAYVCHQTAEEIKASRMVLRKYYAPDDKGGSGGKGKLPDGAASPFRDRPIAENRKLFERMKQGRFGEGGAVLRMRGDLHSENSAMWDPAAYRIMFAAHPRTGGAWCIYPTYDYTHCIVDSLEDISHSLCTLEFGGRQAVDGPYYWLLHKLKLYKPTTWEYSRLNITHCVMSKRKLKYLVVGNYVDGWDDPRLVTLEGFRRRGFSAAVINRFCEKIGVTRAKMTAPIQLLEQIARDELDRTAPRRFVVLKPLKVVLKGMPAEGKTVHVANHPKEEAMGTRPLTLRSECYIERDDFREVDDPKFFGLAPGKEVGLLGMGVNITCDGVEKDADGNITSLTCSVDLSKANRPKGHLHWVDAGTAVPALVRMYSVLFAPEDPEAAAKAKAAGGAAAAAAADEGDDEEEGEEEAVDAKAGKPGWLELLNPESCVNEQGLMEAAMRDACGPATGHTRPSFQFQRLGYFCVDSTSTLEKPVINRIVALKEDREAKNLKA